MVQKGSGPAVPKPASAAPPPNYEKISQDPLKFVVTFIEKKIRNLDKRKAKLDGYRKMVEDGKPLDPDQTAAAAKYDEVIGSLEFAKDLIKNFEATINEVAKQQRKATRKEQVAREEEEVSRIRFVVRAMRIMELLHENEAYQEDFLNTTNDACSVSQLEMDQLVKFYELFIKESYEEGSNVVDDANKCGSHMYDLTEGRSKTIVGTTYKALKAVVERISSCGYFEELSDSNQPTEIRSIGQGRLHSVGSESVGDDAGVEEKGDQVVKENGLHEDYLAERESASLHSEAPSSPALSSDGPLKTEEFLPSGNANSWQQTTQQQPAALTEKLEAEDYLKNSDGFQYAVDDTSMIRKAYEAQRIQEVLAEVQGPCQFLQESIIDHEINPSVIQYSGIEILQQPHPASLSSRNRPMGPAHIGVSALDSAFQNTQNLATIDPAIITPQGLPAVQQHLVKESEHLPTDQTHDTPITSSTDQESKFHNVNGSNAFIPTLSSSTQPTMEYGMGPPSRQQGDNLGLGQTTFGGQQKMTDPHRSYVQTSDEQIAFQPEEISTTNKARSITQPSGIQNMIQTHQLQNSGSPIPHIPLPNEQQSGYQRFQAEEASPINAPTQDPGSKDQQKITEQSQEDLNRSAISEQGGVSQGDGNTHKNEHTANYGSRNSNQPQPGAQQHRGRGGSYNSGYRSGGSNQGNYRGYNNYRGGRYNGNYDSIGRPNFNNFQGNQSGGNGYRNHQEHYSGGYRRGGGIRNNRGGQGRGSIRGGGNYSRSRTYNRPPPQSEQTA